MHKDFHVGLNSQPCVQVKGLLHVFLSVFFIDTIKL